MFQNPLADYVYPHPCDPKRPLFYCVDTVHLIKCVRNNWLNQKNSEQAMYYPGFNYNFRNCNNDGGEGGSCSNRSTSSRGSNNSTVSVYDNNGTYNNIHNSDMNSLQ